MRLPVRHAPRRVPFDALRPVIEFSPEGALVQVRVVPRAGRSGLDGTRGDALLVRLTAAPVDEAANAELVEVLAAAFAVPRRAVEIVAGKHSRLKRVRIAGVDEAGVAVVLARAASRR